jgi:plastocyanin
MVLAIAALPLLLPVISARASSGSAQTTTTTTTSRQQSTSSTTTSTSSETTASTSSSPPAAPQTTTTATASTTQSTAARQGDKPVTLHPSSRPTAHAAGDPSDTIVDFSFSPATVTIHVGDTVTWTNQGKQPHTATANDGSFDTGTLKTGQSASHQFTKAGTFAYICSIHPFMHGTVIVQGTSSGSGSTGNTGSSSGSGATSGTTGAAGTTGSTPSQTAASGLPNTGLNLRDLLIAAFVLVGAGILLRRQLSS